MHDHTTSFCELTNKLINDFCLRSFGESELDLLNKWAYEGENIIHGRPSGIDNTVSIYGAGGGGCVLTLLPTLLSATVVDKVTAELESCGFQCLIAAIGGQGVQVCFGGSS